MDESPVDEEVLFNINTSTGKTTPWNVVVYINNVPVSMQIDTGASVSIMSETTFKEYWPTQSSSPSQIRLCSYSSESITVVGSLKVNVVYKSQTHTLPLVNVKGSGPTLMGHNWLQVLSLDWQEIFHLHNASNSTHSLHSVLEKHPDVFREGLGTLKGFEAKILVDPSAPPKYCKSRSVPYFLREKLEKELNCLVSEGTLEPV